MSSGCRTQAPSVVTLFERYSPVPAGDGEQPPWDAGMVEKEGGYFDSLQRWTRERGNIICSSITQMILSRCLYQRCYIEGSEKGHLAR